MVADRPSGDVDAGSDLRIVRLWRGAGRDGVLQAGGCGDIGNRRVILRCADGGGGVADLGYQLVGFGTATIAGFAHLAWQRRLPGRRDFGIGWAVGVCYAVSQLSMMHALNVLPATLIYPTVGTTGVALNVILAHRLWRERLLRRQVVGVVVAVLVVLLMNLDRSASAAPGWRRRRD